LLRCRQMLKFIDRPHDGIELPAERVGLLRQFAAEMCPVGRPDDEQVDVAATAILTRGVRAKEKRQLDPPCGGKSLAKCGGNTRGLADDLGDRSGELRVGPRRPQSQVAKTPALDETRFEHQFQGALRGMGVRANASSDLTCVQLLPRRRDQQGKDLARDAPARQTSSQHRVEQYHGCGRIYHSRGSVSADPHTFQR
jgi:hypothetical protein